MEKQKNTSYMEERGKKPSKKNIIFLVSLFILAFIAIQLFSFYKKFYQPNISFSKGSEYFVYLPSGSGFEDVKQVLYRDSLIKDKASFEWVAKRKGYPKKIYPGRYRLKKEMSNKELITLLRSGHQSPTKVTFNNIKTINQLAEKINKQIETDSTELVKLLESPEFCKKYGHTPQTVTSIFIPNTYELYWTTDAKGFIERMFKEHNKFWNSKREKKRKNINMSIVEVNTIASIVSLETNKKSEMRRIAGVYINRLRKKIALQADPTIKFAIRDFSIKRVLNKYLEIDSPYNTYKYRGLPPGPISIPSIAAIDAVLDYEKHKYIYFCAKDDFSGYHVFARSLGEHNRNAARYRRALNKLRIYK